ncbi:MAG: DUF2867 domain-containing protein [bacterium]|nr:DUF2867 domain-containing protein [bacterium]
MKNYNTPRIDELDAVIRQSDIVDAKVIEGEVTLRRFLASMLSYHPWWIVLLVRVREVLVFLLGLAKHEKPSRLPQYSPTDVPFTPGEQASFFILRHAREKKFWLAETPEDKHLTAHLAIVQEPVNVLVNRFHVITIVKYKHWTGRLYYNLIFPFHHMVVHCMMRKGIKPPKADGRHP